jgi:hypothetical protein
MLSSGADKRKASPTMNYAESNEYREAMIQLCIARDPRFFITLAYHNNRPYDIHRAQKQLLHFHAQLDHFLLGRRWASLPDALRTGFIAIPEGRCASRGSEKLRDLHYHLLITPPPSPIRVLDEAVLRDLANRAWTTAVPSGSVDVQRVHGHDGVASYICKRLAGVGHSIGREWFLVGPAAK